MEGEKASSRVEDGGIDGNRGNERIQRWPISRQTVDAGTFASFPARTTTRQFQKTSLSLDTHNQVITDDAGTSSGTRFSYQLLNPVDTRRVAF